MTPTLILLSTFAHAWDIKTNQDGHALHWPSSDIHYSINTNGSHGLSTESVEEAITNAANEWNQGSTQMIFDGSTKKSGADYSDGVQSIVFKDNWTEDPAVLAITYTWSTAGGEIVHFDMEINAEDHDWSTNGESNKQDLRNAITHEFGHAIGLDHSEDIEATMAPDAVIGETNKRDLNADDLEGYQYIYENVESSAGTSNSSGTQGESGTSGGVAKPRNNNGQTGNGMVPLENAGCASTSNVDNAGLWVAMLSLGIVFRRSRSRFE